MNFEAYFHFGFFKYDSEVCTCFSPGCTSSGTGCTSFCQGVPHLVHGRSPSTVAGRRGFVVHIARFRCRFEGANCLMCQQELVPGSEYGVFSAKHLAQQKPGSRIDQSELNCLNQLRIVSTHGRRPSVLKVIQDQAQRFMNVNYLSNPISPIMTILDDFQTCSKCQRLVCYHRIGSPIKIGMRDESTILIPLRISLPQPSPQGEEPVEVPSYLLCRPRNRAVISVMPMKVSKSRSSNQNTDDEAQTSTQ